MKELKKKTARWTVSKSGFFATLGVLKATIFSAANVRSKRL
jgi:hypothetical protein